MGCRSSFDDLPNSYRCPQCQAPKKRFVEYDKETGKPKGGSNIQGLIPLLAGLAAIAGLFYAGLKLA